MTRCRGVAFVDGLPGIGNQLLQSERDAFLFVVELEHLDGDLVAGIDHFGRMSDAAIGHVADVQQAIDAAEIDERAVFGEVLDRAGDDCAFFENLQRGALADEQLFFDRHLARHHHVAAAAVQLDDLDRDILAEERIQVVSGAHIDLRSGHESGDADIHRETAFDASGDAAGDHQAVAMGLFEIVPAAQAAGFFVREQDVAFRLHAVPVHHYVDQIAGLNLDAAVGLTELLDWNQAFRLVSEVDDHVGIVQFYDTALEQFAFVRRSEMAVVFDELLVIRFFSGHG